MIKNLTKTDFNILTANTPEELINEFYNEPLNECFQYNYNLHIFVSRSDNNPCNIKTFRTRIRDFMEDKINHNEIDLLSTNKCKDEYKISCERFSYILNDELSFTEDEIKRFCLQINDIGKNLPYDNYRPHQIVALFILSSKLKNSPL